MVATVLLGLALAALRVWWGFEAERRWRRVADEIAAEGSRLRPGELNQAGIPDASNSAWYLIRAAAAVDPNADCPSSTSESFYPNYLPFSARWRQLADASVAASGKAFALAREARAHGQSQWQPPPNPSGAPSIFAPLTNTPLLKIHHLANTIGDAALDMHLRGDDGAALGTIRDGRHLARSVDTFRGMAGAMSGRNHDSIMLYRLQMIATGLRIARENAAETTAMGNTLPSSNPPARPATRAQVVQLIGELLDERPWNADLVPALRAERAMRIEAGERAARSTWLLRPMVLLDLARLVEADRTDVEAAAQPSWPKAVDVLRRAGRLNSAPVNVNYYPTVPPPRGTRPPPADFAHLLTHSDLVLKIDRAIEIDMHVRIERRMAAVSLAVQFYRADHGDWPPDLAALVPQYLKAVPVDPFSLDGAPLRYLRGKGGRRDGGDRPIVYSVNLDGKDDTPDLSQVSSEPQFGWRRARDVHLDLARWTPATQPAQ